MHESLCDGRSKMSELQGYGNKSQRNKRSTRADVLRKRSTD